MGRKKAVKKVVRKEGDKRTGEPNRPLRPTDEYPSPLHEYIYSPNQVTYDQLIERWKGVPGCSESSIRQRGQREGWPIRRREFWDGVQSEVEDKVRSKLAETMAESIVETNNRHIAFGRLLQTFGRKMVEVEKDEKTGKDVLKIKDPTTGNYIPATSVGDVIRFIREGADMERKALGLADQVVRVQFARDVGKKYVEIIKKYIDDPVVLRNIIRDFDESVQKEVEELDRMTGGDE